ncbi:hypothetical protein [Salinibius halmophilus]|uniref:hypothetical protein n=1 Tax=Salinibius halmophilus TaxID=1853216 RepID=UPI000E66013F|nr:hypothetical protein [Salinibius halmophilus]
MKLGIIIAAALAAFAAFWWQLAPVSINQLAQPVAQQVQVEPSNHVAISQAPGTEQCEDPELINAFHAYYRDTHAILGGTEAATVLTQFAQSEYSARRTQLLDLIEGNGSTITDLMSDPVAGGQLERLRLFHQADLQAETSWIRPLLPPDTKMVMCDWAACLVTAVNGVCNNEAILNSAAFCSVSEYSFNTAVVVNSPPVSLETSFMHDTIDQACEDTAEALRQLHSELTIMLQGLPFAHVAPAVRVPDNNEFVLLVRDLLLPHWPNAEQILTELAVSELGQSTIPEAIQQDILGGRGDFSSVYTDPELRDYLLTSLQIDVGQPILCGQHSCLLTSRIGYEYDLEGMLVKNLDTGERYRQPAHVLDQANPGVLAASAFCQPITHNQAIDSTLETLYLCR